MKKKKCAAIKHAAINCHISISHLILPAFNDTVCGDPVDILRNLPDGEIIFTMRLAVFTQYRAWKTDR